MHKYRLDNSYYPSYSCQYVAKERPREWPLYSHLGKIARPPYKYAAAKLYIF